MKKLVLALAAISVLAGCERVATGNVGVSSTVSQVDLKELPPDWYVTITKTVREFTTKELAMQLNNMNPKTADNLTMQDFDVDVYFRTNPAKVADLVVKYQGDTESTKDGDLIAGWNRVYRSAREAAYAAAAEVPALQMNQKREEIKASILAKLQKELNANDPDTFTVTDVNIRSLVTDPRIEETNRRNAEMQNEIDRKAKEVLLAKEEARRLREIAQGQADANDIINKSLTGNLLELKRIEAQTAFANSAKGTNTVVLPSNQQVLVGVGK